MFCLHIVQAHDCSQNKVRVQLELLNQLNFFILLIDSGASTVSWRLSPSSSGYKSQSQISESITPSPTSTPNPSGDSTRQDSTNSNTSTSTSEPPTPAIEKDLSDPQLVWAVTDIHSVPKGSIIINPQVYMFLQYFNYKTETFLTLDWSTCEKY